MFAGALNPALANPGFGAFPPAVPTPPTQTPMSQTPMAPIQAPYGFFQQ